MMIPMGGILAIWFVLAMIWHSVYRRFMDELGYADSSPLTKTVVDIFKQAVPICTFVWLDLGTYVLTLFGITLK